MSALVGVQRRDAVSLVERPRPIRGENHERAADPGDDPKRIIRWCSWLTVCLLASDLHLTSILSQTRVGFVGKEYGVALDTAGEQS